MNSRTAKPGISIQRWQLLGLMLWRGGLAFVAAYGFYYGAWQVVRAMDWPQTLTIGASIALAGFGLVFLSLILERRSAARDEGNLLDDEVLGRDEQER